jgi:hypothetical protein
MIASPPKASADAVFRVASRIAENDFAALSALLVTALAGAAGEGEARPASVGVEFTTAALSAQAVDVSAWVERATRTLIFVAAEAKGPSGVRLAVASGVFRVIR